MISPNHYDKCKSLLRQLIEPNILEYKEAVEQKEYDVRDNTSRYKAYKDEFDPNVHRNELIEQSILPSVIFNDLQKELVSNDPRKEFYLYGRRFSVDVDKRLKSILDFSLMIYNVNNVHELIQGEFENLYYSIYEENFTVTVKTIVNFDSMDIELLNQGKVNITIQKQPSYKCVVYEITDSKKKIGTYKINPLDYPETIIDISVGILRIYKNREMSYVINEVNYSPGCPKFLKTETSSLVMTHLLDSKKDYIVYDDELQEFKEFFQHAYLSEEQILMAIQRFSIACERESDDDRILDLVFALEILFGKGDADSIKHKVLIRLLNLISSKKEVRKILYEKMSDLYGARSTIVHGLERKPKYYTCIQNLGGYQEVVRQAIRAFINTMKSENFNHQEMMHKLDYDKRDIYEIDMTKIDW